MKRGSAGGFLPASAGQEHHFGSRCPFTRCPWYPEWGPRQSSALPNCTEPRRVTCCATGTSLPAPRRGAGLQVCKYIIYSLYYPPPLFIV